MAVIGYARVSTVDQNPQLQLDALHEAGAKRIYTDHGVSGSTAQRPQLDACLDHLRKGDVLTVWKLDRLVDTGGGDALAVGAERHTVHQHGVAGERLADLFGIHQYAPTR